MLKSSNEFLVELNTPRRGIFKGHASSVELRVDAGSIAMNPRDANYLSLTGTTEITLHVGRAHLSFVVRNATASQRDDMLILLAETIHPGTLDDLAKSESQRRPRHARARRSRD